MNLEGSVEATSAQSRRAGILVQLLKLYQDPSQALGMAKRMERFIVCGAETEDQGEREVSAEEQPGADQAPTDLASKRVVVPERRDQDEPSAGSRKPTKRRWTHEDEEQLAKLCGEGLALEQIAAALDRTPLGVRERARVLRLRIAPAPSPKRPNPTDQDGSDGRSGRCRQAGARRGYGRRGRRARLKGDSLSDHQRAEEISRFLAAKGANRPDDSIETVITFMRSRDYSVVRSDNGRYIVDEREDLSPEELISRANRVRANIGREPFPTDLLKSA